MGADFPSSLGACLSPLPAFVSQNAPVPASLMHEPLLAVCNTVMLARPDAPHALIGCPMLLILSDRFVLAARRCQCAMSLTNTVNNLLMPWPRL